MKLAPNEVLMYHDPDENRIDKMLAYIEPFDMEVNQLDWCANKFDEYGWGQLLHELGFHSMMEILNKQHPDYVLFVEGKQLQEEELIHTVIRHPRMIKGPIVCTSERCIICEEPTQVIDLFKLGTQ